MAMHLWFIDGRTGTHIVRAPDEEAAIRIAVPAVDDRYCPAPRPDVKWLQADAEPGIVWSLPRDT